MVVVAHSSSPFTKGCYRNDDRTTPKIKIQLEHTLQWRRRRRHSFWFVLLAMSVASYLLLSRNRSGQMITAVALSTSSSIRTFQHRGSRYCRSASSIVRTNGGVSSPVSNHGMMTPTRSFFNSFSVGTIPILFRTRINNNNNNNNYYSNYASTTEERRIDEEDNDDDESYINISGYRRPKVNWFPGHIAKAERLLSETLKSVDVVIEVRDARAPKATAHPNVGSWSAGRPRVVVLTRLDAVTSSSRECWRKAYAKLGADGERGKRVGSGGGLAVLGGDEKNRNAQWRKERRRFDGADADDNDNARTSDEQLEDDKDVYGEGVEEVLFVDAKRGQGTHAISRAVYRAGRHVNERRNRRGLNDRPLRVGIIGFPNVGKSALINRLLGRRRAKTANTPGVTRSLQWIRVATDKSSASASGASNNNRSTRDGGGHNNNSGTTTRGRKSGFELLDSPGIIPSDLIDQNDALILAACNSIGVGAYDNQAVAAYLCDRIQALVLMGKESVAAPQWRMKCKERYGFDPIEPLSKQNIAARWGSDSTDGSADTWIAHASANQDRLPTGEDMLFIVADNTCRGDPENAARKILQDFRDGRMGPVALQLAPETEDDDGQSSVNLREDGMADRAMSSPMDTKEERRVRQKEEIDQRAKAAMEAANAKGIDLPPAMSGDVDRDDPSNAGVEDTRKPTENEVGKGLFDGW